jgi:hypothetical protein
MALMRGHGDQPFNPHPFDKPDRPCSKSGTKMGPKYQMAESEKREWRSLFEKSLNLVSEASEGEIESNIEIALDIKRSLEGAKISPGLVALLLIQLEDLEQDAVPYDYAWA